MKPIYHNLEFGITCIDTQHMRQDFVAAYLIENNNRAAFIDTGCYLSVPTLLATLEAKNISRESVDYIILTHIHLDHAGGHQTDENRHKAIKESLLNYLLDISTKHGVMLNKAQQTELFKGDLEICAQGLGIWLDKEASYQ
ncbi:Beta-lactamase related protein [Bathymodiolus heckerae thiotrophic gill symbiont]|uniref:MBL fold metallo-hydrolase n=1 Tax=Bathymodiolus heckerae thiotrophic gill symbiont TaxID=1052212 RepID=UPI0010B753B9|nr:MBL fold metallo-hydrolase [Bathymodiolus heckerae thiotrophic gill symbiont]SHN89784.1 Beta-lactamase related protein [Bathymodiolus heckerae thiotrophic gill symbiont]